MKRRFARAAMALLCACATAAQAQPSPVFDIERFVVTGDNPLGEAEAQRVLAPFARRGATLETLQQALDALQLALKARGHSLHDVGLAQQALGRVVTLHVSAIRLGQVQVQGQQHVTEANVRAALPALREGEVPDLDKLAVQLALANENAARQLQLRLREGEEPGKVDAVVDVTDSAPLRLALELSTAGSKATGRDRTTVSASHADLFGRDHQLVAAYTTSLQRPSDVKQFGLSYAVPLPGQLASVAARYTRSDVVGDFGAFTSTGAGHALQLSYTLMRPPQGSRHGRIVFSVEDKLFEAAQLSGVPIGMDRRSRTVGVAYAGRVDAERRAASYAIEAVANTGAGPSNDLAAYRSEYARIARVRWFGLRAQAAVLSELPSGWRWSAHTSLQYTPHALIAAEQFGLGGLGTVRGTRTDRAISGDRGLAASVELLSPSFMEAWRALVFVDAGWIANHDADGVQRLTRDRIASTGIGLRYQGAGAVSVSADYGRVVVGSRFPAALNPAAPRAGDGKLHLQLGLQY